MKYFLRPNEMPMCPNEMPMCPNEMPMCPNEMHRGLHLLL